VLAFGVGIAVDVAYVVVLFSQRSDLDRRVLFFTSFIGVMSALFLAGAALHTQRARIAQALLYAATAGYVLSGAWGAASIGWPLLLAGLVVFATLRPRIIPVWAAAGAITCSAAAFISGIAVT
jgi:hypothetical protein